MPPDPARRDVLSDRRTLREHWFEYVDAFDAPPPADPLTYEQWLESEVTRLETESERLSETVVRKTVELDAIVDVDSWCEACGRKHTMRGQIENCGGCGGNRFVFRSPLSFDETNAPKETDDRYQA